VRQVHRTGGFEDLAGYSRAVRVGNVIAVAGTAGLGADGRAISPDVYEQARHAFELALDAIVELGGTPGDVTRTRIYLSPGADWRRAIDAHRELFAEITPVNTTLYVAELIPEGAVVEIELEAVVDGG
jgi:enamine deaminase RidA (YjgF/YER057c/UK114 family)